MPTALVVPLHGLSAADRARVGGKAAGLGELIRAGLPVPDGFCVSADAYRAHLREHGLVTRIRAILERIAFDAPASVEAHAAAIRALITDAPLSPALAARIARAHSDLGPDEPVAVRSSATAEDLPDASFAGQHDSYLNVRGKEAVLRRIRDCWASGWTARAVAYRERRRYAHLDVDVACVVQRMVPADVAGVAFTVDPSSGDRDRVIVDAVDGLGEELVSGRRTADQYALSRSGRRVLDHRPGGMRNRALLEPRLDELLSLCLRVEAHFGCPQDVEWAVHEGRISLVQARPVTAPLPTAIPIDQARRPIFGSSLKIQEILPSALTPAGGDLFAEVLFPATFEAMGAQGVMPGTLLSSMARSAQAIRGRIYVNVSAMRETFLPGLDEATVLDLLEEGRRPAWSALRWRSVATLLWKLPGTAVRLLRYLSRIERHANDLEEVFDDILRAWQERPLSEAPWRGLVEILRLRPSRRREDFLRVSLVNPLSAMLSTPAFTLLSALVARWTDEPPEATAWLVSGLSGILDVECTQTLWELAQLARTVPELARRFEEAPARALESLPDTEEARAWRRSWDGFVARFGHRTVEELELARPRWREEPGHPLSVIANYLRADPSADPRANERRLRDRRLATEARILARLSRRPIRRALFVRVSGLLRQTSIARQNSKHHMVRGFDLMRRAILEMGRRLAGRGLLERADDVFFLRLAELEEMPETDLRPLVEARKRELARWQLERPARLVDAEGRAVRAATPRAARETLAPGALRGIGTSPGRVRGRVRVVTDISYGVRIEPGEVLVAPFTDPAWTPLFPCARAVVVEVGSLLSHASIVARELGVPCVVAVPEATRRLRDGEQVEVDGSTGIVTVLPAHPTAAA